MIGNEFAIKVVKGGAWGLVGDGPAGFSIQGMPRGLEAVSAAVDLALRQLGLEMQTVVEKGLAFHITFGRIES
jgi:hypothetical protein